MGWSYDPTALTVPLNQVRFLIGDTVPGDPLVEEDAEVLFCLSQKGDDIYLAGAMALRRAATRIARELGISSSSAVTLDIKQQVDSLTQKAADLESEALKQGGANLFLGGISKADVQTREANTDRVVPAFTTDKHMPATAIMNDIDPEEFWYW